MGKTVKTSEIKKQYKDKKTGATRELTINYAKVVDRLNAFREDHPHSKIATKPHILENGTVMVKAYVWRDKNDFLHLLGNTSEENILLSADSDGTARSDENQINGEKGFEKLETIAVGRALALLGYAASGEIASSEEMEEFENFKKNKAAEAIQTACKALEAAKTMDELRTTFSKLEMTVRSSKEVVETKDRLKEQLTEKKQ